MWSDFCQCKEQALFTLAACLFLWNADQAFAAVEANCSLMQPPSNCPEIPCPRCVRLSSFSRKPYVFKDGNSTDGFLYALVDLLLSKCCGNLTSGCWQMIHHPPETDPEQLLSTVKDSHLIYPVLVDKQDMASENHHLIGLVPPGSIAFVVPKGERDNYPKKLMMAVFEAWPVLILTILLSILAGVFLWLLDTWFNEKEFPRTFFRGSWEGFWWAFVSMTTVGYGDRSPRSILGRTFAVVWILVGVCICSIFTATLTTSLTAISLDTKKSLPGSKVGVLKRSIEMALGMQHQADLKLFNSVEDMRDALDQGEIEGILLDNYQISHYTETLFPRSKFKIDEVLKEETLSYGAMVNDSFLAQCFSKLIAEDKYLIYDFTKKELNKTLKGGGNEAVQNSQSIFDPTGDLFFPSLYSCLVLIAVIFFIGLTAEVLFFKSCRCPKKRRKKDEEFTGAIAVNEFNGGLPALDQMEIEMMSDIRALFAKYRERLQEWEKAENNGNASTSDA